MRGGVSLRCIPVLLFVASAAFAQEYTASLSVTVTDPSDAVVPKAHVALTDNALQRVFEAETNAGGLASFASLQPGQYSLEITKTGFESYLRAPRRSP